MAFISLRSGLVPNLTPCPKLGSLDLHDVMKLTRTYSTENSDVNLIENNDVNTTHVLQSVTYLSTNQAGLSI